MMITIIMIITILIIRRQECRGWFDKLRWAEPGLKSALICISPFIPIVTIIILLIIINITIIVIIITLLTRIVIIIIVIIIIILIIINITTITVIILINQLIFCSSLLLSVTKNSLFFSAKFYYQQPDRPPIFSYLES